MNESPLIAFDRRHKRLLVVLSVLFVTLVGLRLHGWSLPMWHQVIDASPRPEVLIGQERAIRADDWLLDLPNILAQVSHSPTFPIVNRNIGMGEVMLVPIMIPMRNFTLFLRPFTWGFWISQDVGLAFMWWGLSIGIFYSFFLVFMLVSRNNFGLSVAGALFLLYSPYFQFWSLHKSPIAIFWALAFVASAYILSSHRRAVVWGHAVLLGWAVSGLALAHLYPPIAVPVAWLFPFAAAAWFLNTHSRQGPDRLGWERVGAFAAAAVLVAGALGLFLMESGQMIALIQNTAYPGRRFSLGGGYPLWPFFSHNLFAAAFAHNKHWLGNICEGASFLFTFPLVLMAVLTYGVRRRRVLDYFPLMMSAALILILAYTYVGFPLAVARWTLFGFSTINRTQMAIGIANSLILVSVLAKSAELLRETPLWSRAACVVAWIAILCWFAKWMHDAWPVQKTSYIMAAIAFNGALASLWLIASKPQWFAGFLTLASFLYCVEFNPLVRGGTRFLFENPLSQQILQIDREQRGAEQWVAMGDWPTGNLFQILGVKSLGGYHGYPHFPLWAVFDPNGKFHRVYNQCAFVSFMPSDSMEPDFAPIGPGLFEMRLNPASPLFTRAGVRYFVATGDATIQAFEENGAFEKLLRYSRHAVFRRR